MSFIFLLNKMHKLLFIFICTISIRTKAQDNKIIADRPGETENAELMHKGYVQAEIGFRKDQKEKEEYTIYHPGALLRYRLFKQLELRAALNVVSEKMLAEKETGLQPLELGFKLKLLESKGAIPELSLLTHIGIPGLASEQFRADKVFPGIRLLFQNEITEKIELGYNIGSEWDGFSSTPQWVYTFSPQFEIADKWELFIEVFGQLQKGEHPQHHVDGGVVYYINDNVKCDLSGGMGLSPHAMNYFVSTGISFQLKTR